MLGQLIILSLKWKLLLSIVNKLSYLIMQKAKTLIELNSCINYEQIQTGSITEYLNITFDTLLKLYPTIIAL